MKRIGLPLPLVLGALLSANFVSTARAELQLDGQMVEVKPKPEDEEVTANFTFTNSGSKTVKVLGLDSKCSCLSADLDSAVYEPGAKGSGTATFKVGSFVGRHEKFVVVKTDDPEQQEWVITFVLDVPAVVDVEPRALQWWVGDTPTEKQATVRISGETPIKVTNITATRQNVEFTWKEVQPGREYIITVKPTTTADVMLGALKIETDSKIPKYQRQLAFFSVYRKPDSGKAPTTAAKP